MMIKSQNDQKNQGIKPTQLFENPVFINSLLLILTITLFILKLIFSLLTNSIALQADAIDSLTDIVMYIIAVIGILFAKRKPNARFPYGYYKLENIVSLFISLFIFFTAYIIILQSISAIFNFFEGSPRSLSITPLIFIFLLVSLLSSLLMWIYLKSIYKKTGSPIIESETKEKRYDLFISLSVIIGFIGISFNLYVLDSIISFL